MIGHLLAEPWLAPVRDELEAGARMLPWSLLLALPLAFGLGDLYPWARAIEPPLPPGRAAYFETDLVLIRGAAFFAIWSVLAWIVARPRGRHRAASAIGLMLLLPTITLAATDWILSVDPAFLPSLFGLAFGVSQMVGALAAALLVALFRAHPDPPGRLSMLAKTLFWVTLGAMHLWFTQFIIVWSANFPEEAAWYLARSEAWTEIPKLLVIGLTAAALPLLMVPGPLRRGRAALAAGLLLVQHGVHTAWLVRPEFSGWSIADLWIDPVVLLGTGGAWLAIAWMLFRRRAAG
jgi:hypothetical protein